MYHHLIMRFCRFKLANFKCTTQQCVLSVTLYDGILWYSVVRGGVVRYHHKVMQILTCNFEEQLPVVLPFLPHCCSCTTSIPACGCNEKEAKLKGHFSGLYAPVIISQIQSCPLVFDSECQLCCSVVCHITWETSQICAFLSVQQCLPRTSLPE